MVVAVNCSKIHTSRGQRRYRNSFRSSTFSRGPLLPGFSPQRRWPSLDNDLRHDRAGAECVPGSHRVLVCHAPRATKHNHDRYSKGPSLERRSHATRFFSQSPLSLEECRGPRLVIFCSVIPPLMGLHFNPKQCAIPTLFVHFVIF